MNNVYARVYVNEIICLELCRIEIMKKNVKIYIMYIYIWIKKEVKTNWHYARASG